MTRKLTVTHPTGEVSTRRTDADYTHAVVVGISKSDEIERLRASIVRMRARMEEWGARYERDIARAEKAIAALEAIEGPITYGAISWHTRCDLAEKKRSANTGRRYLSVKVVEVDPPKEGS